MGNRRVTGFRSAGRAMRAARKSCLAALVLAVVVPGVAQADFGVTTFSATTTQPDGVTLATQAGGHPFLGTTSFKLNATNTGQPGRRRPEEHSRRRSAGGHPEPRVRARSAPREEPTLAACGVATQIGETDIYAGSLLLPPVANVPVFNMVPEPGQVSRFAFSLGPLAPRTDIVGWRA